MPPSRSTGITLVLAVASLLIGGCDPTKKVSIALDPPDAAISVARIRDGREEPYPVNPAARNLTLPFPSKSPVQYRVTASRYMYRDASALVTNDGQSEQQLQLKLPRYLTLVSFTHFDLKLFEERLKILRLVPETRVPDPSGKVENPPGTEAYVDTREPADKSGVVRGLSMLDVSNHPDIGTLSNIAASPTEDAIVFQVMHGKVEPRKHVVQKKETIEQIADQYDVRPIDLKRLNNLGSEAPRAGQELLIEEGRALTKILRRPIVGPLVTEITDGRSLDLYPTFTTTGESIVFSSNMDNPDPLHFGLWRVSAGGASAIEWLTQPQWQDYAPSAGPDGTIAFTSLRPNVELPQIWLKSAQSSGLTRSVSGEWPQINPVDPNSMLFLRRVRDIGGRKQLWVMSTDGRNERNVTRNTTYNVNDARWSLDGKWIAYAADEYPDGTRGDGKAHPNSDIFVISADGRTKYRLTQNGSWDDNPAWDRTGNAIYFRSNRGGQWRIWRLDLNLPSPGLRQ